MAIDKCILLPIEVWVTNFGNNKMKLQFQRTEWFIYCALYQIITWLEAYSAIYKCETLYLMSRKPIESISINIATKMKVNLQL